MSLLLSVPFGLVGPSLNVVICFGLNTFFSFLCFVFFRFNGFCVLTSFCFVLVFFSFFFFFFGHYFGRNGEFAFLIPVTLVVCAASVAVSSLVSVAYCQRPPWFCTTCFDTEGSFPTEF